MNASSTHNNRLYKACQRVYKYEVFLLQEYFFSSHQHQHISNTTLIASNYTSAPKLSNETEENMFAMKMIVALAACHFTSTTVLANPIADGNARGMNIFSAPTG